MATIIILESGLMIPNQLLAIGAKATMGMALAAIANGIRAPRANAYRAVRKATMRPATRPIANPPAASISVVTPARNSSSASSAKAPAMALGAGSRKRSIRKARTKSSQSRMPPRNTAMAGR